MNTDVSFMFLKSELVPAIVQDDATGQVLMLAYMNRQSLEKTLETGRCTFFSRSRGRLCTKGETSGNFMNVCAIYFDCDCDSLLVRVRPDGPACHTGNTSCFFRLLGKDAGGAL